MRILIAEDDPVSLSMLSVLLKRFGHDVIETHNGHEAWNILKQTDSPRLAILDWMMPGLDGLEVIRKLRALSRKRTTYLIMLTTKSASHDMAIALREGADDYLIKPFDPIELQARIDVGRRFIKQNDVLYEKTVRLDAIYALLPVGIVVTDKTERIIDANPSASAITGLTSSQHLVEDYKQLGWRVLNANGMELTVEDYPGIQALRKRQPVNDVCIQLVDPAGNTRYLVLNACPLPDENSGALITYTDITAYQQTRISLQSSEEKHRAMINQSMDAVYLHDAQGNILDANQTAILQTGYSLDALMQMNVFDLHVDLSDKADIFRRWQSWKETDPPPAHGNTASPQRWA